MQPQNKITPYLKFNFSMGRLSVKGDKLKKYKNNDFIILNINN